MLGSRSQGELCASRDRSKGLDDEDFLAALPQIPRRSTSCNTWPGQRADGYFSSRNASDPCQCPHRATEAHHRVVNRGAISETRPHMGGCAFPWRYPCPQCGMIGRLTGPSQHFVAPVPFSAAWNAARVSCFAFSQCQSMPYACSGSLVAPTSRWCLVVRKDCQWVWVWGFLAHSTITSDVRLPFRERRLCRNTIRKPPKCTRNKYVFYDVRPRHTAEHTNGNSVPVLELSCLKERTGDYTPMTMQ
jgi:hypothetical protein